MTTRSRTSKPTEIASAAIYRVTDKRTHETFYLVQSDTHADVFYAVRWDDARACWLCPCESRKPCKHIRAISEVQQAKRELATEKVPVPARQYEDWSSADAPIYTSDRPAVTIPDDDMAAHIQDSIESGELDWIDEQRAAWANATPDERRAMYCDDFGIYDYASYGAA